MISRPIPPTPLTAERSPWLRGPIRLPGDPIASALILLLAAMARGESVVENLSAGPEAMAVLAVLRTLGPHFAERSGRWHVQGIGTGGFLTPAGSFDLAGAGDTAPLLLGLLGAHDFETELSHVAALPMSEALLDFIRRGGGRAERTAANVRLRAPRFGIPLDLALSSDAHGLIAPLLLQALVTTGTSTLHLPAGLHDPAEALLALFGAKLGAESTGDLTRVTLDGMAPLRAQALAVPGDPRLAAFPAVAALIAPNSEITISAVTLHPGGLGLLDALALLGGDIAIGDARHGAADITVRHSALVGTTLPADLDVAPDDYPILAIAAAFAEGETLLDGLGEGVRRLALTRALRANGIDCIEQPGGLMIRGKPRVPGGGNIVTRLDPKLAMAFLVLGMAADRPVTIDDGAAMADLFPGFIDAFEHIGASFQQGTTDRMIIAVDGPAASGKGTLALGLARHYGLPHLDTGLLYRAVGLAVRDAAETPEFVPTAIAAALALDPSHLTDLDALTGAEAGILASRVAVILGVREAMRQYQRDFAHQPGGAVLDGRDIGTVVCPDADVKLFIEADSKSRMERRARQFEARGEAVDRYALYHQIEERDARDRANPHGGFFPAPDAHLLDTTRLDIEAALRAAVAIVDGVLAQKAKPKSF